MKDNRYENELLDFASKLDAVTNDRGNTTQCAIAIVEDLDHAATIALLSKISSIINSNSAAKDIKIIAKAIKDSILMFYGYTEVKKICDESVQSSEDTRSLSELLHDLDELIGLKSVKSKVNDLIAYQKVQMLRAEQGLYSQKGTLHLAFTGNPGTGKTTVARIVGRIYKHIGLLSKGHFVEVSRTDLIAGYQGQTAHKVKKVIEEAKGGVLFIDEAYSITENDHSDSYGRECLTELTKALEDSRDDLVVIVAGYTEPMSHFFASNPGLKSRFNTFIEFPDYSVDELRDMLMKLCTSNDYALSPDASQLVFDFLCEQVSSKNENFANGRLIRNIYDDLVMNHARRVAICDHLNREELSLIIAADFNAPHERQC